MTYTYFFLHTNKLHYVLDNINVNKININYTMRKVAQHITSKIK